MPRSPLPCIALLVLGALAACENDNALKRHNAAPEAAIATPAEGEVFRQGAALARLTGTVSDSFDPPETLAATVTVNGADPVALVADADGNVATDLSLDTLPLGPVVLTLSVTDSDGASGSDSVTVDLEGPLGPPAVVITVPTEGTSATVGDSLAFQGSATDDSTPAASLAFAWSSDLDGPLGGGVSGGGTSALITAGLSIGLHTITLTATDTDGESGSAAVTITVAAEEVVVDPGDVVFSEMMVNPAVVDDEVGEWVELYNTSGGDIDIGGYSFRDDDVDDWVLAGPLVVAAHDFVVLCADMDPAANGGVPCDGYFLRDFRGGGLALANGEDELVLTRPDGLEIDWLHYDDTWYTPAVGLGLDPGQLDGEVNDDPTWWCDQATITPPMVEPGTPGGPNDPCPLE